MMRCRAMDKRMAGLMLVWSSLLLSCASTNEPARATVCEIVANPKAFLGKELAIRAVWSASYHGVLLQDESCPKVGMSIQYPEDSDTRGSVRRFMDLIFQNSGAESSKPKGPDSFTGRLIMYPNEIPYLVLELHSFSSPRE